MDIVIYFLGTVLNQCYGCMWVLLIICLYYHNSRWLFQSLLQNWFLIRIYALIYSYSNCDRSIPHGSITICNSVTFTFHSRFLFCSANSTARVRCGLAALTACKMRLHNYAHVKVDCTRIRSRELIFIVTKLS